MSTEDPLIDHDFAERHFLSLHLAAHESHDPGLEPYASMSRDQIEALMKAPEIALDRWAFLEQFLLDRMTTHELETHNHALRIATFLVKEYGAYGPSQCKFLYLSAQAMAKAIAEGMPPRGAPQECN